MDKKAAKKRSLFKQLRDKVAFRLALYFSKLIPKLPLSVVQSVSSFLGSVGSLLPEKRKDRVKEHLEIAFPPKQYTEDFRKKLLKQTYIAAAQVFLEALWVSAWKEKDDKRLVILQPEKWKKTLALSKEQGKGLAIFTAHIGSPEIIGNWFVRTSGMSTMAVAAHPKNPLIEGPMIKKRESSGLKLVFRGEAGIKTFRHLRQGGALAMFVDHNLKGEGLNVPFFGKEAHTLLAPAKLALQSKAIANTFFILRGKNGQFLFHCDDPIELPDYSKNPQERKKQEAELILEYTKRIENVVRQYPEQYLWMHKRWQKRSDTLPLPSSSS
jgi:Kdo2-lipid IVA lauroyltransferase/acyltransferase